MADDVELYARRLLRGQNWDVGRPTGSLRSAEYARARAWAWLLINGYATRDDAGNWRATDAGRAWLAARRAEGGAA